MKVSPKQYATSLYEAVKDKKAGEVKGALANFVKLLVANNDLGKADKIIAEFVFIWNREHGLVQAEVISARQVDKESAKAIERYVKELSGARQVELSKTVDEKLLAGFVLKFNDLVLDGSLKTKISELKEEMKK